MNKASALFLLSSLPASAATIFLDNAHHSAVVTTGSQSSFGSQSFRLDTAGGTAGNALSHDNVALNSPLPTLLRLETITFVESPTDNASATGGDLYLKIFTDAGATGAPVAVSLNAINVRGAIDGGTLSDLTWNFGSPSLSSSTPYLIRWSTNAASDNTGLGVGRVAAANFGGGFVSTYSGGVATSPTGTALAFDSRFEIGFSPVPEPAVATFFFTAAGTLLRRRRR